MTICVDFDGTIVKHCYPDIGEPIPGAVETLKWLAERGVKLILYTMRSHPSDPTERDTLQEAMDWCKEQGIQFWAVNWNPGQSRWTNSKKVHCDWCIDDRNIGTPMNNGVLDWVRIRVILEKIVGA